MYFENINDLQELRRAYHKLAIVNHPDLGGDLRIMQAINAEYETAFIRLRDAYNATADGDHTVHETPAELVDILNKLIHLMGIDLEICGSWLWISGDTMTHRETLKAASCRWAPKKGMWYWHSASDTARPHHRALSMDRIRELHGSQRVNADDQAAIA